MSEKKMGVIWDLTGYFPEFKGPDMIKFKEKLFDDVKVLQEESSKLDPLCEENEAEWEAILLKAEDFSTRRWHLASYVGCLSAADASNEAYMQEEGKLARLAAETQKFDVDIQRAFKETSDEYFEKFLDRENLKPIKHFLRRIRERAQKTMSREQEMLAADLGVDGIHAWGRLYDTITGKLEFDMVQPDGTIVKKPISEWRSLMSSPDFNIGKAAFEGGNKTWQGVEDICAAALNAISGTRLTLYKYKGIDHFLDKALFMASIKRESLDAMYQAIHDRIDVARDIFVQKAKYLGREGIWFFEREAPLPLEDTSTFSWEEGRDMVADSFRTAFPDLADYYQNFLEKMWLESEARAGKRPGAFCTGSPLIKEQRVYMTYNGALGDITTLAHEVGHAFHGHVMKDLRTFAKEYPMTLAETASIFAEHILADGIYENPDISDQQKLLMLDADVCNAAVLLLDITVRFEFEKAFHEERPDGELSVSRFKELMVETQKRIWGNALTEGGEDPMFWASKLHFYISQVTFYNFPYTFGFLLARALYNRFKQEGVSFLPKYIEFLKGAGSDTVENIAMNILGANITDPAFWAETIDSLQDQINLYKDFLSKGK